MKLNIKKLGVSKDVKKSMFTADVQNKTCSPLNTRVNRGLGVKKVVNH